MANLRKPYGTAIQEIRRYASFIGTSNQKDLLTDPSGSRRFICIEVSGHFRAGQTNEEGGQWMTPMQILNVLQKENKDRLSINKVALFGRSLHKLGISTRRRNRGTEYYVVKY